MLLSKCSFLVGHVLECQARLISTQKENNRVYNNEVFNSWTYLGPEGRLRA